MNIVRTTIRRLWGKNLVHTPGYTPIFQSEGLCIGLTCVIKVGMIWKDPLRVIDPYDVREVTKQYQLHAQEYIE